MQITPPIIVLAAVWRVYRPSPIIFPDRHADPGNQRRPDQGTAKIPTGKKLLGNYFSQIFTY